MTKLNPRVVLGMALALLALVLLGAPSTSAQTTLKPEEQQVLDLVNQQRAANGLQPLTMDTRLVDAARAHNAKMIQTGEFSHQVTGELPMCEIGPNNDRFDAVGYPWTTCGENIAAGQPTPDDVMKAWMGSSGHRANILNPGFKNIGIGYTTGGGYGKYWTQDFGTASGGSVPPPQPTATPPSTGTWNTSLIWRNTLTGQNTAWLMNGGTVVGQPTLPAMADVNAKIVGVGDLNADGKADLVWRNTVTGQNTAWLINGGTVVSQPALPAVDDLAWKLVGVGDLNADGKADLLWRNFTNGRNVAWLMNGATATGYPELPTVTDWNWKLVGVGDLNADGKADLVWRNFSNGRNVAWLMNGVTPTSYPELPTVADMNWKFGGVGDLNGDRKADLVWRNTANGQNVAWLMNGATATSYLALPTVADQGWKLVAMDDLNADGKADLVWRNTVNGQNTAWLMNGATATSYPALPTVTDLASKVVSPVSLLAALIDPASGLAETQANAGLPSETATETLDRTGEPGRPMWSAPRLTSGEAMAQPAPTDAPPMWTAPTGGAVPGLGQ